MRRKGFTLIELLVVIVIIAMLLAILIPSLRKVKMLAQSTYCVFNLKGLARAWNSYASNNKEMLVNGGASRTVNPDTHTWIEAPENGSQLYPGDNAMTTSDEEKGIQNGQLFPYMENTKAYHCPADNSQKLFGGLNGAWINSYSLPGLMNGEESTNPKCVKKIPQIVQPGLKMVFLENADTRGWLIGSWIMNINPPQWTGDRVAIWHGKQSNMCFADGHAEKHTWVDTLTINNAQKDPDQSPDNPSDGNIGEDLRFMEIAYVPGRR
jgi:prepilin-type N-terminal cleavage/methylation domain-containing protein/prepilin-type processing-associated H-X9-DG protein